MAARPGYIPPFLAPRSSSPLAVPFSVFMSVMVRLHTSDEKTKDILTPRSGSLPGLVHSLRSTLWSE